MRWISVVLLLAAASGCARRLPASDPLGEATRHRAALATLRVDNQTAHPLVIAFEAATVRSPEIVVGSVGAHARADMAPVAAAEPIYLRARTPEGTQLQLPPRTLEIGATWTWTIPADAQFLPRAPES